MCCRIRIEWRRADSTTFNNNIIITRVLHAMVLFCGLQSNEELKHQLSTQQKAIEQHKSHINKCIDVVKKLLKEKSNIEKKEARQRCMQNRLRLGQFVTQRVGAQFQENWTDGYAFQELSRYVGVCVIAVGGNKRNFEGCMSACLVVERVQTVIVLCVCVCLGDKKK